MAKSINALEVRSLQQEKRRTNLHSIPANSSFDRGAQHEIWRNKKTGERNLLEKAKATGPLAIYKLFYFTYNKMF